MIIFDERLFLPLPWISGNTRMKGSMIPQGFEANLLSYFAWLTIIPMKFVQKNIGNHWQRAGKRGIFLIRTIRSHSAFINIILKEGRPLLEVRKYVQ